MTPRHRHLIAILLVLVHVLGPALHQLQHAVEAVRTAGGEPTCAHAFCQAHAVASPFAQLDADLAEGLDGLRPSQAQHDHDCELCSRLHRTHGYVGAQVWLDTTPERLVGDVVVAPHRRVDSAFVAIHRARAPPRNAA